MKTLPVKAQRDIVVAAEDKSLPADSPDALIREIAMDIGKEVVHHIEIMYPDAFKAASSTFPLSVRNCVHNEIIAAIKVNDEGKIIARLAKRKKFRRKMKAAWKDIRK